MSKHGLHKDPGKHRLDCLARYHENKADPAYRERRRLTRRRYYERWLQKIEPPVVELKAA